MSVSGNATGVRFGVATSTNRPATPFDGQVISETDTDRLVVYNGSAWGSYGGLQFIKSQTIGSGVSSVEVTGAFSSTYDNYLITVSGGVASGNVDLKLTLGATATGYYYGLVYVNLGGTSPVALSGSNATSWAYAGSGTSDTLSFFVNVDNPFATKRTMVRAGLAQPNTVGAAGSFNGFLANDTSYTAFTITTSSGTITGGTIRVYGYLNS